MSEDVAQVLAVTVTPQGTLRETTLYRVDVHGHGVTQIGVPHTLLDEVADYLVASNIRISIDAVIVGWDAVARRLCCQRMVDQICRVCRDHWDTFYCPDQVVVIVSDGSYGLIIHDGGGSFLEIHHCPWCGSELPRRRDHG